MFCFMTRGPLDAAGAVSWTNRRSVEVLGFHPNEKEVRILVAMYVQNELPSGEKNYLHVLHPGNARAELKMPHLDIKHDDEIGLDKDPVMSHFYGRAFQEESDGIYQVQVLTAWDEWIPAIEREKVSLWPLDGDRDSYLSQIVPLTVVNENIHVPFTAWRLGPFTQHGPHLVFMTIAFSGATYSKFILDPSFFVIDGPDCLVSRILHDHISLVPDAEKGYWRNALAEFEGHLPVGEGYDVILLGKPCAADVEVVTRVGISEGPLEGTEHAKRYISTKPWFNLFLKYVDLHDLAVFETVSTGHCKEKS